MKQKIFLVAWSVLCVVLGVAIGRRKPLTSTPPAPVPAASRIGEVVLPDTAKRASQPTDQTLAEFENVERAYVRRLQALVEMNRSLARKISVPLLDGEVVNGDFVKVYELSAQQETQINNLFTATKRRIARLEADHAVIAPKEGGEFIVSVPPFPAEGGAVYNETMEALQRILGDERFAQYRAMAEKDFESTAFGMFGLGQSLIEVKPLDGPNGRAAVTSTTTVNPDTGYTTKVETNARALKEQSPELYQRMTKEGLLREEPGRH